MGNQLAIIDGYPQVDCIMINYIKEHSSFVGHLEKVVVWTIKPQSEPYFILKCLNRECTSIGFDLSGVI